MTYKNENYYQVTVKDALQPGMPIWFDQQASTQKCYTLIWNDGPNDCQFFSSQSFTFGMGQPIPAKTPLILKVDGSIKHYAVCAAGQTCKLYIYEAW